MIFSNRINLKTFACAIIFVSFSGLSAVTAAEAPTVKPNAKIAPNRVLFIGNSYLYYNDSIHNHVRRMAIAADPSITTKLRYKSATISGSALHDHNINAYLEPDKLRVKEGFEIVILQGASTAISSDKRKATFAKTVAEFDREIRKQGGQTALYMTQAYVEPHKKARPDMIREIEALYVSTGNKVGALVIPVGLAFEEAYKQRPNLKLHKQFDGSHPDLIGTYLASAVVFASLYGKSPVGIPYDYYGALDKDMVVFLQKVAETTVNRFYGVQLPSAAPTR